MNAVPQWLVEVYDHQEHFLFDLMALQRRTEQALPLIFPHPGPEPSSLLEGGTLEFTIVDDSTISRVHGEFLNDPTPTDVITFHHGEVLISADTASRQAEAHGQSFERELLLYAIHGLLHLHGHDDHTSTGAATMKTLQESILDQILPDSFSAAAPSA